MAAKGLYQAFRTNRQMETEGVILDFGVARFKVRRAGGSNRRFTTVFNQKTKPHARALAAGTLDEEVAKRLMYETYYDAVVIEWEGVTDEEGNSLKFTQANFIKVMSDLPDLWSRLRDECDNMRNFQDAEVEEAVEKMGESSFGSPNGALSLNS